MRRRRRIVVLLLTCAALVACSRPQQGELPADPSPPDTLRIVTLSPHLAELAFEIGAGDQLVGVSAFTDYPESAARLPVVGDAFNLDQEQLTLLRPNLLLAWDSGTPAHVIDELRARGFQVEVVRTTTLGDLPKALRQLGKLVGRQARAEALAEKFSAEIEELAAEARDAERISVFYQVHAHPLYTINGDHYLSEIIEICGGRNIFADLTGLAPLISVESVLEREPEVILASSDAGTEAFAEWQRWPDLAAIKYGNQFLMPANEIGRATSRLLKGAGAVCRALERSRRNRERAINDRLAHANASPGS